jgi:hypothetical protein
LKKSKKSDKSLELKAPLERSGGAFLGLIGMSRESGKGISSAIYKGCRETARIEDQLGSPYKNRQWLRQPGSQSLA